MRKKTFLMPAKFRFVGILFFILGFIFGVARFKYGLKPEILDMKVFALQSSYLQTKYLEFIGNNMGEELTSILLLTGLFLIAFSRENDEIDEFNGFRLKAFFISAYANFLFLIAAIFFTFGLSFVYMLIVNMGFGLLVYIIVFHTLRFRSFTTKPK